MYVLLYSAQERKEDNNMTRCGHVSESKVSPVPWHKYNTHIASASSTSSCLQLGSARCHRNKFIPRHQPQFVVVTSIVQDLFVL